MHYLEFKIDSNKNYVSGIQKSCISIKLKTSYRFLDQELIPYTLLVLLLLLLLFDFFI